MPGFLDRRDLRLVDLLAGPHDDRAVDRRHDVLERHAPEDALADRLDHLAAFDQRPELETVLGAAVLHADDHVLRDVHEASGQIPRVRRLERRVRETLAGAVGGR